MTKHDEQLLTTLKPSFTERELTQMQCYFDVTTKHNSAMRAYFEEKLAVHPVYGPLMAMQTYEQRQARNAYTDELTRKALFEGEWEPLTNDLIMQGITYAKVGMEFNAWYEVVAMVKDYLLPVIVTEFEGDLQKLLDALAGLGRYMDFALQAIAESYFIEKRAIIEEQRARQEVLIRDLESFAYVVSHDLKSPLRGISKLAEWLVADYHDKLDEEGRTSLRLLTSRVQRMDSLIDGILEYSRLGRQERSMTNVDLNELLRDIIDMHSDNGHVRIAVNGTMPSIRNDRAKLGQVFSNLISNAIKHNDKEKIDIEVNCEDRGDRFAFSITDNGPGIDPEYHERVFGMFQTLQPKDERESTGIGLPIVKRIVEDNGGNISLNSESGRGATFTFTIPKQTPEN
ncbi:MAG: ATP-binding protein [Flavobacteriales bacterium]|nr:ATP-binding protein [Flavobacteriales bacterium]